MTKWHFVELEVEHGAVTVRGHAQYAYKIIGPPDTALLGDVYRVTKEGREMTCGTPIARTFRPVTQEPA